MGRLSLYGLFVGFTILLISASTNAQRQRQRGQYGRRAAVPQEEILAEAAPVPVLLERTSLRPKIYEVHHEIAPNLGDGHFKYYSATSDGLESEQVGHFSNPLDSQVHQGSYTTKDEHGRVVKVDYVADKDGFRPIGPGGAQILPTPPPVPLEHVKARHDILALQRQIRNQHLGYLRAGYAAQGQVAKGTII